MMYVARYLPTTGIVPLTFDLAPAFTIFPIQVSGFVAVSHGVNLCRTVTAALLLHYYRALLMRLLYHSG